MNEIHARNMFISSVSVHIRKILWIDLFDLSPITEQKDSFEPSIMRVNFVYIAITNRLFYGANNITEYCFVFCYSLVI